MEQVVCILDFWPGPYLPGDEPKFGLPRKGAIYTITHKFTAYGSDYFRFSEIDPPRGWWVGGFRPLKRTSIESLQAILANPHLKIKEDV